MNFSADRELRLLMTKLTEQIWICFDLPSLMEVEHQSEKASEHLSNRLTFCATPV